MLLNCSNCNQMILNRKKKCNEIVAILPSSIDIQLFRFTLNLTTSASFNPESWTWQWLTSSICEWCFGIDLTFTLLHLPDEWLDNVYRNIIIILIYCDLPFVNISSKGQVCNLAITIYYLETCVRFFAR